MDQRRRRLVTFGAGAAAIALAGGVVGGLVVSATNGSDGGSATGACDAVDVAAKGLPSVVTIQVTTARGGGSGSGEVIREGGYILTNDHVISAAADGGGTVSVRYNDGTESKATIVGRDVDTDIAVLDAADGAPNAPVIAFGSSTDLKVGQPVVALGAPLGLSGTVTAGIVSALNRELTIPGGNGERAQLVGAVQTDASINPGNSGGPLVDCDTRLVGVNSAIVTVPGASGEAGGGSVGLGFAIPVDLALRLADELIENGRVAHPTFGIEGQELPASVAAQAGLPQGVYVRGVVAGGPAAEAGIRPGDVITEVDGRAITSVDTIVQTALTSEAGDTVDVTFSRNGATRTVPVELAASAR